MKNMPLVLNTILSKDIFHYFQIDKEFNVISYSYGIDKYFPNMQQIIGSDIRDYLPELIGSEEGIIESFMSENDYFKLYKVSKNDYYIDISIENCDAESILVMIQDNTATIKKQLKLLQYSNELTLINNILQSIFDQQSSLMVVTDNHMIKFANKKFIEFYKSYNQDFNSYHDIFTELSNNNGYITLNNNDFLLEVVSLDTSHKLFTLIRIEDETQ